MQSQSSVFGTVKKRYRVICAAIGCVTIAFCIFAWSQYDSRQAAAIHKLRDSGALISFADDRSDGSPASGMRRLAARVLAGVFGNDGFQTVSVIEFVGDAQLSSIDAIIDIPGIHTVTLAKCTISPSILKKLAISRDVEWIRSLDVTFVDDAEQEWPFDEFSNIRALVFSRCKCTKRLIQSMQWSQTLANLFVTYCDDVELLRVVCNTIPYIKHLQYLDVSYSSFQDEHIGMLSHISKLRALILDGTKITDNVLTNIVNRFPGLTLLSLVDTSVSDGAIASIVETTSIEQICINQSRVMAIAALLKKQDAVDRLVGQ